MRALTLLLLVLLAGCAKFDSWFYPEKSAAAANDPSTWARADGGEDQAASDLYSCRTQAQAMVERDRSIDQDIGDLEQQNYDDGSTELQARMDEFGYEKQFEQITSDCMQKLGYGEAMPAGAPPAPGSEVAPPAEPAPPPAPAP